MLFQLLFGKNKKKGFIPPASVGSTDMIGLELDAMILEAPEYSATPTRSQVESGADITDHVTLAPEKLSIEGIITNTPVGLFQSLKALTTQNAAQDAFDFLLKLYTDRQPFNFVGGFKLYENMVITSFSPSRSPQTGGVLQFRMSMEQIRFVESEIVSITKFKADVKHQGAKKQSLGSQATETASAKSQSKGASVLAKWLPNLLN